MANVQEVTTDSISSTAGVATTTARPPSSIRRKIRFNIGGTKQRLCFVSIVLCVPFLLMIQKVARQTSISLPNGDCEWTQPVPLTGESQPYGTLLTSYPASGMRTAWQQIEGLTGIEVGDDYAYSGEEVKGIIKTQYPHYDGIWSYGSTLDQVILIIRNPRWAIPSFHRIISEMNYAQDWEGVYSFIDNLFGDEAPNANWIKWRDIKFEDEIKIWAWHIDYWMEEGSQYWHPLDYERIGQFPFHYNNESSTPWIKDEHCRNHTDIDCFPKAIIAYEKLEHYLTGPDELRKIANVLRGKKGMTVLPDESINCIWFQTFVHHMETNDVDIEGGETSDNGNYNFTTTHIETILGTLKMMKDKYSQPRWRNVTVALDLVSSLDEYIKDTTEELYEAYSNPAPTPAPDPFYHQYLVEWYESIGLGNRYSYEKVHNMIGYWPLVKDLFNETYEEEQTTIHRYHETSYVTSGESRPVYIFSFLLPIAVFLLL